MRVYVSEPTGLGHCYNSPFADVAVDAVVEGDADLESSL